MCHEHKDKLRIRSKYAEILYYVLIWLGLTLTSNLHKVTEDKTKFIWNIWESICLIPIFPFLFSLFFCKEDKNLFVCHISEWYPLLCLWIDVFNVKTNNMFIHLIGYILTFIWKGYIYIQIFTKHRSNWLVMAYS